ncbi:Endochitinase 1 [Madurella mycetomatis]|uniref:chitinase n=1 Tax=Madurella mycetomatis TaxID=100816 RepID=A0A175WC92_9PEZI|nr:Endochitinase 1 [Madurella mycetomatis]KXX80544.1 Endochitinase 1 [Madurella mycetomatis]
MQPSPLRLVAPFLLLSTALARPTLLSRIDLGPEEEVEVLCQDTTVTETVWLPSPSGASSAEKVGEEETEIATSFEEGEDGCEDVLEENTGDGTSEVGDGSFEPPNASEAVESPQQNANQTSATSSFSNATVKTIPPSGYRNALYFTNWYVSCLLSGVVLIRADYSRGIYGADYQPQELPADKITHVLYAFADIASDGEVVSSDAYSDLEKHYPTDSWNDQGNNAYGCVKQLYILKKKHRHMKTLLSIGGWTYSSKFAPVAATEAGRQRFCSSAVQLLKDWGFDGLDIDWEYPVNSAQAQDYVLLLRTCRQALDAYAAEHAPGYHFLLTIAAAAGPQNYNTMDLAAMDPLLDAWHLMAYDYAGSWDSTSGHQSNLYASADNPASTKFSTEKAVHDYLARGVPAHKLVLGLPLYGRAFEATTGLGQPYSGIGEGSIQNGVWLYKDLPRPGAAEMYDDVAMASYSFDAQKGELISYDTARSAVAKAGYVVNKGLGGAVFWEASGDKTGEDSLVATVKGAMGKLDGSVNLLSFPASRYDNIKAGMPGA